MWAQEGYNNYSIENPIIEREIQLMISFPDKFIIDLSTQLSQKYITILVVLSEKVNVFNAERDNEPYCQCTWSQ